LRARAIDVSLDHRGDVVVRPGIAGNDPTTGAVTDDDHPGASDPARPLGSRAITTVGLCVTARLDLVDDLVELRAVGRGGQRVPAGGGDTVGLVEVAAVGVAESVVGIHDIARRG
jgi:hypothetical protein